MKSLIRCHWLWLSTYSRIKSNFLLIIDALNEHYFHYFLCILNIWLLNALNGSPTLELKSQMTKTLNWDINVILHRYLSLLSTALGFACFECVSLFKKALMSSNKYLFNDRTGPLQPSAQVNGAQCASMLRYLVISDSPLSSVISNILIKCNKLSAL